MKSEMESVTEWLFGLTRFGGRSGIENSKELLEYLGNPQDSFVSIHVAGSDGKGSTCAFIESVLRASGVRTGLFTSPHILRPNERIRVCGTMVTDEEFVSLALRVKDAMDALSAKGTDCRFFEAVTAMAFLHFREKGVECAVVETGMGGRLDATNVLIPKVSVITNISLEHTKYLGDTLSKIATEKAGIIKPGVPVVTCNSGEALETISRVAAEKGSELIVTGNVSMDGSHVGYAGEEWDVGIPGTYQGINSAMAYEALVRSGFGDRIRPFIAEGMKDAEWPARMQRIAGTNIIVDVTHTAAGMEALRSDVLRQYGRTVTVFGLLDDKDLRHIAGSVASMSEHVIVTRPDSSRALDCASIMKEVAIHTDNAESIPDFDAALDRAEAVAGDRFVLITGSFAMAESAFRWLERKGVHSAPFR